MERDGADSVIEAGSAPEEETREAGSASAGRYNILRREIEFIEFIMVGR
jgi:hypothetical protein